MKGQGRSSHLPGEKMGLLREELVSKRPEEVNFLFEIEPILLSRDEEGAYLILPHLMREILNYDL